MKEATEQEYKQHINEQGASKLLKVTEEYPHGSYSITYYMDYAKKVMVAHMVFDPDFGKSGRFLYYIC